MIVIDDLSSIKEWDSINLPKTNTEGRIIVTTSTENIAKHSSNKKDENIYTNLNVWTNGTLLISSRKRY